MTNYKEILRLHSLGINNTRIAESCGCARSTVIAALQRAREQDLSWNKIKNCSTEEVARKLYPSTALGQQYKMPDYEWVHREMQKSGVTLSLLWVEYCEQCRQNGELPYKSTQFNKYYADYVHKTKATMHLEHKPGETMQVDWAGQTVALVDTDSGERLETYLFVAVLPYSGYAYTEAFLGMKQESWITGHVNAYRYFGGVTRILTPDNLKTGIVKNSRTETVPQSQGQGLCRRFRRRGLYLDPGCSAQPPVSVPCGTESSNPREAGNLQPQAISEARRQPVILFCRGAALSAAAAGSSFRAGCLEGRHCPVQLPYQRRAHELLCAV